MEVIQIENRRPSSRERNVHSFGRSEHIYDGFYRREAEVVYQLKLLIAAVVSRIVFRDRPVRVFFSKDRQISGPETLEQN